MNNPILNVKTFLNEDLKNFRIFKFAAIGLTSIGIQSVLFNLLILATPMKPFLAVIVADQPAIVTSFLLNNAITFKDRQADFDKELILKFGQFYLVVIVSALLQAVVVKFGNLVFGYDVLASNIFFVLGLGLAFLWNYFIQSKSIWKKQ